MSEPRIAVNSYIFWSDKHGRDYVDHNTAVFLSECDVDARNRYADFIIAKGLFDVFGQLDQTSPDAQELLHHCDEILKRESLEENPIQEADELPIIPYEYRDEKLTFEGGAYRYCVTVCNYVIRSRTIYLTNGERFKVEIGYLFPTGMP